MSGHTWSVVTQLNMADNPAFTLKQVVANDSFSSFRGLKVFVFKAPSIGVP